ncbi:retrovirus-related pol polyprotein from transposon TNT 1-94 [Tanacetum coccineum]
MTGDHSQLRNFVEKFIGTSRFGNDHFGAIMGYEDYVIGDKVAFRKHSCYVRDTDGVELIKVPTEYYERVGIFHQKLVPRTLQQNDVVKRRNRTLVEAARTMLIFPRLRCFYGQKLLLSLVTLKIDPSFTLDLGKLQPTTDIGIFVGYAPSRKGYRIYNKSTRRIMETIHVQFDELTEPMAPVQLSTGPALTFLTPGQIKPPHIKRPVSPALAVTVLVNSAGTPSSTTIDQDAPSPSHSPSSSALQSPNLQQGVASESAIIKENLFAPINNDLFVNVFAPEPNSEASSSEDVIEPKNFKSAITEDCWFQAMQDEIHEFDRLQVWELVPQPDCVMIIALKWIYKVKLDEYGDVLKNKAMLVAKGY